LGRRRGGAGQRREKEFTWREEVELERLGGEIGIGKS